MTQDISIEAAPEVRCAPARRIPGEAGIWVFIFGDVVLFSLLFGVFLFYRASDPALFHDSQAHLNQALGLTNTLLMLTSSWLVATAVRSARRQQGRVSAYCFALALACAVGFVIVKYFEYAPKIRAGITLSTNDFFMFYFVYTGIHLIHVTIGSGVLIWLISYTRQHGMLGPAQLRNIESGASFWHLVDLLWIVLFALLYLVP